MFAASMTAVMIVGLLPMAPPSGTLDRLERNYCFDAATGGQRFVQMIYWREHGGALHVDHWEMDQGEYTLVRTSARSEYPYTLILYRGDRWMVLKVREFVETHTLFDPEVEDRSLLPLDARCGLAP